MKKAVLLLTILFKISSTQGQDIAPTSAQGKLLLEAHQSRSDEKLSQFFSNWQTEIPTASKQDLEQMNNTLQEAYKVFTAFYRIKLLKELGGFKNNIQNFYDDATYLLIQNSLDLHVTDQVYWAEDQADSIATASINSSNLSDHYKRGYLARPYGKLRWSTIHDWGPTSDRNKLHLVNDRSLGIIENFRPTIDVADKQPVYLSSNYTKLLYNFLGSGGSTMISTDSTIRKYFDDLPLRLKFVESRVRILRWTGYHLHSGPYIRRITLERNLKYARVDYELWTEGGEAILKNEHGKWILQSATRLWIE